MIRVLNIIAFSAILYCIPVYCLGQKDTITAQFDQSSKDFRHTVSIKLGSSTTALIDYEYRFLRYKNLNATLRVGGGFSEFNTLHWNFIIPMDIGVAWGKKLKIKFGSGIMPNYAIEKFSPEEAEGGPDYNPYRFYFSYIQGDITYDVKNAWQFQVALRPIFLLYDNQSGYLHGIALFGIGKQF